MTELFKPEVDDPCAPYCTEVELLARLPDGRERYRCRECGKYMTCTPPPATPYGAFCAVCTNDIDDLDESRLEPIGRDGGMVRVCLACAVVSASDERYSFEAHNYVPMANSARFGNDGCRRAGRHTGSRSRR